jgi:hypothetical protein
MLRPSLPGHTIQSFLLSLGPTCHDGRVETTRLSSNTRNALNAPRISFWKQYNQRINAQSNSQRHLRKRQKACHNQQPTPRSRISNICQSTRNSKQPTRDRHHDRQCIHKMKQIHQPVWIRHSAQQRTKHYRCRGHKHHQPYTKTHSNNSVHNPADADRSHKLVAKGSLKRKSGMKRKKRPSPEIPIARDFPPFLFIPGFDRRAKPFEPR